MGHASATNEITPDREWNEIKKEIFLNEMGHASATNKITPLPGEECPLAPNREWYTMGGLSPINSRPPFQQYFQ